MKKLKKLPKKQLGGHRYSSNDSTPGDTTTGQIQTRDVANNDIMKYFNDLEAMQNRRDPGMSGDVVPTNRPVVDPGEADVTTRDLEHEEPKMETRQVPEFFQKGGDFSKIGKSPFKRHKKISKRLAKSKSPKVNRRGLYKT